MFDKNTEASFVLNGVFEFIKAWQSGSKSRLTLQSKNGQAWINFNCCLGGPFDQHEKLSAKPKAKSKKKQERDNLRAQLYQQRLRDQNSSTKSGDGSLNLQLSSLSSQNESQMPMEGVSSSFIHTAASSSPKNADLTRNEKSDVSDSIPSNNDKGVGAGDNWMDELEHYVQLVKQSTSTSEKSKIEELYTYSDSVHEYFKCSSLRRNPKYAFKYGETPPAPVRRALIKSFFWDRNFDEKIAEWNQMIIEDPSTDLRRPTKEYLKQVQADMDDSEVFYIWSNHQEQTYRKHFSRIN